MTVWGLDPIVDRPWPAEHVPMDFDGQQRIHKLRQLIERGDYVVSADAVAGAIVRCVRSVEAARADMQPRASTRRTHRRTHGGGRVRPRGSRAALVASGS
jgi:hypothetical protein